MFVRLFSTLHKYKIDRIQVAFNHEYPQQIPVITLPVGDKDKRILKTKFNNKNKKEFIPLTKDKIISARRKEFDYYKGQQKKTKDQGILASKGWHHRKSIGDHFTIKNYLNNPSVLSDSTNNAQFDDLDLHPKLLENLKNNGFFNQTNVQFKAIPTILSGHNALITSETGNGKTISYLVPVLQQILNYTQVVKDLPNNSPYGVIVSPNRELAIQIKRVAVQLLEGTGIEVRLALGTKIRKKVTNAPRTKVHLLIGTAGALSVLTTLRVYKLNYARHLILDEVDSLLDDSFKNKVVHFMRRFPIQGDTLIAEEDEENDISPSKTMSGVQLILVSATTPTDLAQTFYSVVDINSLYKVTTPFLHKVQPHVEQKFIRVGHDERAEVLLKVVKSSAKNKLPTIIFSNDSKTADWISLFLNDNNIKCINFHGNMAAPIRYGLFDQFQDGEVDFISCTDICSRGLDTVRARHVINYNFPKYMADYIHRCGRTGRVGITKKAYITNFIQNPTDILLTHKIEESLRSFNDLGHVDANIKKMIIKTHDKYNPPELINEEEEY